MTRTYRVNGMTYRVPPEAYDKFDKFIRTIWTPGVPTHYMIDDDRTHTVRKARVPASIRSVSFSVELSAWAAEHWTEYEEEEEA